MVLLAGVAVAIAVVAVAVASYEGTRSDLQSQVDQQLQSLTKTPLANIGMGPRGPHGPSPLPQTGQPYPSTTNHGDPDERVELHRLPPQAFGGPSGGFTLFKTGGGDSCQ